MTRLERINGLGEYQELMKQLNFGQKSTLTVQEVRYLQPEMQHQQLLWPSQYGHKPGQWVEIMSIIQSSHIKTMTMPKQFSELLQCMTVLPSSSGVNHVLRKFEQKKSSKATIIATCLYLSSLTRIGKLGYIFLCFNFLIRFNACLHERTIP